MKKTLCVFLCFFLALCVFSGCEESEESKNDISTNENVEAVSKEETDDIVSGAVSNTVSDTESEENSKSQAETSVYEDVSADRPNETSAPLDDSSVPSAEDDNKQEENSAEPDDGWDFSKDLQVYGGCLSNACDSSERPFVDGFLHTTMSHYEYEDGVVLLYPAEIIIWHYYDEDTANGLLLDTQFFDDNELEQAAQWLKENGVIFEEKNASITVVPEGKNPVSDSYMIDYTVFHSDLSADDMEKIVTTGKEKGFHVRIILCKDDACLAGKDVYVPDECVWHLGYDEAKIPEDCPNKTQ